MRELLQIGKQIDLSNESGEKYRYIILDVLSEAGASCICYVARKILKCYPLIRYLGKEIIEKDTKVVILKEFYPSSECFHYIKKDDIIRNADLSTMNTFRMKVKAACLVEYYSVEELEGRKVDYIFLSTGEKESPAQINAAVEALKAAGYNAEGHVSPGTAHEFLTWRRALYTMAQGLFKQS